MIKQYQVDQIEMKHFRLVQLECVDEVDVDDEERLEWRSLDDDDDEEADADS